MTTQPDEQPPTAYPDSWKRPGQRDSETDRVIEYIRGLSPQARQLLLRRVNEGDR